MSFFRTGRAKIISILVLLLMLATLITMIPDAVEPIEVFAETVDYYELKVGDEVVGKFGEEAEARDVIQKVIDNYISEGQDVVDIRITPAMSVEKITVEKEALPELQANTSAVIDTLLEGSQEKDAYIVQEGDTLWGIAVDNDMTLEELEEVNPELNMEVINVGDEINISEVEYMVNVAVEYEMESEVTVPFEITYEDSPNMYVDEEEIIYVEGVDGSKKVVERVTEINGVVSDKTEISSEIITEPVTQIVVRGTMERPVEEAATEETETTETTDVAESTDNTESTEAATENTAEETTTSEPEPTQETSTETATTEEAPAQESTPAPEPEPAPASSGTSASREAIVNYALQFCGNPYVWGGTSLTNGCDCSGFVYSVFNNNGYKIQRWPDNDYPHVSASELKPGDVVRYGGHYSIYIGNGMEVSALNAARGICTHPMYYSRSSFMYGIRIIND